MKSVRLFLLVLLTLPAFAQVKLPTVISDHMVLQRDESVKIWGWAAPKEKISISLKGKKYKTTADAKGNWEYMLPAQAAGSGFEMIIAGKKNSVVVKDIAFGDVWFYSGQSNMTVKMERIKERFPEDVKNVDFPLIRNFFVPTLTDLNGPQKDIPDANWITAKGDDILEFGAVAYYMARDLYDKYEVPIGIINSSVGGTPIEAWISEEGFKNFDDILQTIEKNKDTTYVNGMRPNFSRMSGGRPEIKDKGSIEHWESLEYQPKGWRNYDIPGFWEDQGLKDLNGVVWFRKEVEVPADWSKKDINLYMGRIVDADEMYVNGQKVGNITYQYPPRRYVIPAGLLKAGKNTLVIRVTNSNGKGGFVPDKPYFMTDGKENIDLKGSWQYKVGEVYPLPDYSRFSGFRSIVHQNQPTALYNAMIAPLINVKIKGFSWYQGESNTGNAEAYDQYIKALINDWRAKWNDNSLPFFVVQLANYQGIDFHPAESSWARLQEAQNQALQLDNTAVIVTNDLGEWNDIHPLNKKDIGQRLALAARNLSYGEKALTYSGPALIANEVLGDKIILTFDHVADGIVSKDGEDLRWFAIAGYDKKFVWAKTKILSKNQIEVWNETVKNPQYVRYAWQDNPVDVNFYNTAGLPASLFRTDRQELDPSKPWMGKKCAVVLTYDDALNVHLDNVIPALDSLSLKGTFYLTASSDAGMNRTRDWGRAARNGHELGNHTLYHPCDASLPGRSWVSPEYDLSKYTMKRIENEIKMCNAYLKAIDGQTKRTFAFTCGDKKVSEGEFIQNLSKDFVAARSVRAEMHGIKEQKLMDIDCYSMEGTTAEEMIQLVKKAEESGKLLVFLFHGVGGEHGLNVEKEAHSELLHYLKEHEKDIYVDTMLNVAEHIKAMN